MTARLCLCGSGLLCSAVHDARGIYLTSVCNACAERRLAQFRPEVLTDPDYDHSEPIDEDDEDGGD